MAGGSQCPHNQVTVVFDAFYQASGDMAVDHGINGEHGDAQAFANALGGGTAD